MRFRIMSYFCFCNAFRIASPMGAEEGGFWPVMRFPSTAIWGCKVLVSSKEAHDV